MKTIAELEAFVGAYARISGYVSEEDARKIATQLALGVVEDAIYEKHSDAVSVIDAYLLWGAARDYQQGEHT